ncbi:biotin/lipoyl-binding protein [bacterium]|nr:biotin/lipoyl-binding protein [candidate division CSSED10-310 bacterium]
MKLRITVHGTAYDVDVEILDPGEGFPSSPLPKIAPINQPVQASALPGSPAKLSSKTPVSSGHAQGNVNSPIAGTILEIKCKAGDSISVNQELLVIEAMKMETSIAAPAAGIVKSIDVAVGDAVREGQTLIQLQ